MKQKYISCLPCDWEKSYNEWYNELIKKLNSLPNVYGGTNISLKIIDIKHDDHHHYITYDY